MVKEYSLREIQDQLILTRDKGYIAINPQDYRRDDGVVGQVLEREFGISENNLRVGDLGIFELKGMRVKVNKNKSNLTLGHQKPSEGMSTRELFDKYGYIKPSLRDTSILKKKLFTTIKGNKYNNRGFKLQVRSNSKNIIDLFHKDDGYLSTWHIDLKKVEHMILVFAKTQDSGINEKFHYVQGTLYQEIEDLDDLISRGVLVMDLCIDQPVDGSKGMHDRGPHWRIPTSKLNQMYSKVINIL